MVRLSLILLSLVGVSGVAQADEMRWTHFGIRPLAMGNAFVAVADDYNAIFYNPAGLARLKEWDGELLNPHFEMSENTMKAIKDVRELMSGSAGDTDSILDFLDKNTGTTHHFALGLTPHLIFKNFGFGIGVELSSTMAVHREISTDLDFGPKIVMPFSFAMNFMQERLSVGTSVKFVARGGVDREFSIQDISAFSQSKAKEEEGSTTRTAVNEDEPQLEDYFEGGTGVGVDFGMLFTPIKTMSPTLGVSITDFGGTPYKKFDVGGEALGAPKARLPSVNTGLSLMPWEKNNMFLRTSVDAHAINQPAHYSKKFNLGAEWGYGKIIKVQSGLHQGEFSGGFEFDVFLFSCRFVTYTEQLGTIAGQDDKLRDRRYALQLKLLM